MRNEEVTVRKANNSGDEKPQSKKAAHLAKTGWLKTGGMERVTRVLHNRSFEPFNGEELEEELVGSLGAGSPVVETWQKLLVCHQLALTNTMP